MFEHGVPGLLHNCVATRGLMSKYDDGWMMNPASQKKNK